MSQRIELWQLSHDDQDKLYINNVCPRCESKIIDRVMNEDYATWFCDKCVVAYWVE
jgi:ribosomal protein L37AE/L43A